MCCATTIGHGKFAGSGVSSASSAGGPPVEVPTSTSPSPTRACRPALPRAAAGGRLRVPRAVPHALSSRALALILAAAAARIFCTNRRGKFVDAQRDRACGLRHEVDGAEPQRFQRRLGALRGQRGHHDDRARALDHDAVETVEAVHLRHVDVERDDVGLEGLQLLQRFQPVARELHLEVGFLAENAPEQLAHQRGIVDDEDLDHASRSARLLERVEQPTLGARQQLGGIEQQHDALRLLEIDHAAHEACDLRR